MAKRGAVILCVWRLPRCGAAFLSLHGAAHGGVVEAEHLGMMARLGVLEHDALAVEGLARHHRHVVGAAQIEHVPVVVGRALHGDGALAGGDGEPALVFEEGVDGVLGDLGREALDA